MNYSLIISIIIGVICITCLIILYVKMSNLNENLNKHITTDLKELSAEITLDKLKVKNLEVDDKLSTSFIYNKKSKSPIYINSPTHFSKNMEIENDKLDINSNNMILNNNIKVNPNLKLITEFNTSEATNHKKSSKIININDDKSYITMELNLNDIVYPLYNNENRKNQGDKIDKDSKVEIIDNVVIEQNRDVNIDNDEDFIYDNNGHKIGIMKEKLLEKSCYNGSVYDVDGGLRETSITSSDCNFNISILYLKDNDIIHISQQLYDHLQNGIATMKNREVINSLMYPRELLNKITSNKYVINTDKQNEPNSVPIETFIDIPSYNYYMYE